MERSDRNTEDAIRALEETLLRHIPDDPRFESGAPEDHSSIIAFPMQAISKRPEPIQERDASSVINAAMDEAVAESEKPADDRTPTEIGLPTEVGTPTEVRLSIETGTPAETLPESTGTVPQPQEDESALEGLRALIDELQGGEESASPAAPSDAMPLPDSAPSVLTADDFESGVQDLIAELNALKADMANLYEVIEDEDRGSPEPNPDVAVPDAP